MRDGRQRGAPSLATVARLVLLVLAVVSTLGGVVGCGLTDDEFGSSTLPPLDPGSSGTIAGPAGTAGPGEAPLIDTGPRSPKIVGEGCSLTPPGVTGATATLTYTFGTSLFELSADADTARCLMAVPEKVASVRPVWAPTGDRFLVGPTTMMVDGKFVASGLKADTVSAQWSTPDGAVLVGITDDQRLVRRPVDGSQKLTNISFLRHTSAAAFHPGGSVLFAAGVGKDDQVLVDLSEPKGKLFRPVVVLPAGTVVTELAVSDSGTSVAFVERTAASNSVRTVRLPDFALARRIEASAPLHGLVHAGDVVAVTVGECEQSTTTRLSTGTATVDLNAGEPFVGRSTQPVGFIGGDLIVASRQTGCTGPADIWAVNPTDVTVPTLLISGVTEASVRPAPQPLVDLPADLRQEPVTG